MEPALRETAGLVLRRGNVTANATLRREERPRLVADPAALAQVLALAQDIVQRIPGASPPTAEGLLALPGVLRAANATDDDAITDIARATLAKGFADAVAMLAANRQAEGARLATMLTAQIDEIAALRDRAIIQAADQPAAQRAKLQDALAALLRDTPGAPSRVSEERLAQGSRPARHPRRCAGGVGPARQPYPGGARPTGGGRGGSAAGSTSWCRNSSARPTRFVPNPPLRR